MEEMRVKRIQKEGSRIETREQTEFGKEVGQDEIHWWVFKVEDDIDELRERTHQALEAAQELKDDSARVRSDFRMRTHKSEKVYRELISTLDNFANSHCSAIGALLEYVEWLALKNSLAPCILYTYRVWGATRLADRRTAIGSDAIETEDPNTIQRLTEIVFGLRFRDEYTIDRVQRQVGADIYESMDPEQIWDAEFNKHLEEVIHRRVPLQTAFEALDAFAAYFEQIRQSLRNILVDIEKFTEQRDLMGSDVFWRKFIQRAISSGKTEPRLWDFKKTIDMWNIPRGKQKVKERAELEFAETVASFANAGGGVLIVGVTNTREIVGIGDLLEAERRLQYARKVLADYISYEQDILRFVQVVVPTGDEGGDEKLCLIIAIKQACNVVAVCDKEKRFTYPIRLETGSDKFDREEIIRSKRFIKSDNYDFISELKQFVYDK